MFLNLVLVNLTIYEPYLKCQTGEIPNNLKEYLNTSN